MSNTKKQRVERVNLKVPEITKEAELPPATMDTINITPEPSQKKDNSTIIIMIVVSVIAYLIIIKKIKL